MSLTAELSGAQVIGTEVGIERIEASQRLTELMARFCAADSSPERCFVGSTFIGTGDNSEVWEIDGLAVKLATPTTGKRAWTHGINPPENLFNQLIFMDALGNYVGANGDIVVPEQYFALRTVAGHYLSVQEHMREWEPMQQWLREGAYAAQEWSSILANTKARIARRVGSPLLRLGLSDIGLGKAQKLHTKNVLVPRYAAARPEDAPLCIIDQPSHGLAGKVAVAALRSTGSGATRVRLAPVC